MASFNNPPRTASAPAAPSELAHATVEIYDQTYHLSGADPEQVQRLAARVDSRMRAVASTGRTADSLRVAVLAALNLADELARAEERLRQIETPASAVEPTNLHSRAISLRGLLDIVLEEESKTASSTAV